MIRWIKLLLGWLLLPACWGVSVATYKLYQLSQATEVRSDLMVWALPGGFLLWVLLYFLLPRPTRTYVLAHELTHALWALMMGGRVGKIRVGKSGGHVELSKTNVWITLAPYFFPFYTFIVITAYYLSGIWWEVEPFKLWWLGAVGFTWSFHITFTLHTLTEMQQPDVREHGRVFSYVLIYLMNVLVIGLWMVLIGMPKLSAYGELLVDELMAGYQGAAAMLGHLWTEGHGWLQSLK